jgi:PhnB protein
MKQARYIPEGCHSVQPYMMFRECAKAMDFYAAAFGAREVMAFRNAQGKVQHAEMQIGDSRIMMADESPENQAFSPTRYGGSPISLLFYTEDTDGMYTRALRAGAKSLREPADQPYGDRVGGIEDPFGYRWWIATHVKEVTLSELQAALGGAGAA